MFTMFAALMLFYACIAIFVALLVVVNRFDKWKRIPHFYSGYLAGRFAVCSKTDYERSNHFVNGLKVVPETIVFSNFEEDKHRSGNAGHKGFGSSYSDAHIRGSGVVEVGNLFVPFVSEAHIPFTEQLSIFIPPEDPKIFVERKRRENVQRDLRLKFVDVVEPWEGIIYVLRIVFLWLIVMSMLLLTLSWVDERGRILGEQPETEYRTGFGGRVWETKTTRKEADSTGLDIKVVRRGVVVRNDESGGEIVIATVSHLGEEVEVFSREALPVGQSVSFRSRLVRNLGGREWVYFKVSDDEANALIERGFTVIE